MLRVNSKILKNITCCIGTVFLAFSMIFTSAVEIRAAEIVPIEADETGMAVDHEQVNEEDEISANKINEKDNEIEMTEESTGYASISGYSFPITDVRTGKTSAFNGNDGKYGIIVLGGMGSCSYTASVL